MLTSVIVRVVDVCCRWAWVVALLWMLLAVAAFSYTVRHIAIDTDTTKLIAADLPWRQDEAAFDAAFPERSKLIIVVVDAATPELAELATTALVQRISGHPDIFHSVRRPDGGPFFDRNGLLFLSTEEVERTTEQLIAAQPLLGSLAADPSLRGVMDALTLALEGVRRGEAKLDSLTRPLTVIADSLQSALAGHTAPLSWRTLITGRPPDPRELRRFILVQPVLDFRALEPGTTATNAIRQAVRNLELAPDWGVRVRLTGPVPIADEEFATVADGAALNATLTVLAVVAILWLALRSAQIIAAILITVVVGLGLTAAFGLAAVGSLNLISIAFAVLFIGLGVDFGIQFSVRYRAERHARDDLRAALDAAGAGVGTPLMLAAASTAAAFYSFLPTNYRGVSELGLIAGTGMIIAFILSITLLPALLFLLRPPGERSGVGYTALAPINRFLVRYRRRVLIASALVAAVCLALLPQVRFDFNPLNLRSPVAESVATLLDLMKDPATTPNTVDVLAPSVAEAAALADRLAALPEVTQAIALSSFVPDQQEEKLALIEDAALLLDPTLNPIDVKPIPTDAETARAMVRTAAALRHATSAANGSAARDTGRLADILTALAEADPVRRAQAEAALIPGLRAALDQLRAAFQAGPVTLATLPPDLVRDWVAPDGRARIQVFPKGDTNDNETLRRFIASVRQLAPHATGTPILIQESGRTIVRAFVEAGLWALLSITLLLGFVLRRGEDVLLTLSPLLLAGLATFGLCVAIDLPLNFANIIAIPLMFGIGVAFNIYFVMVWRAGASDLLQLSLTRAILFSALTTAIAFGSLWFSNHPGTASMGKLLALSLACTLATTLLFLPALLGPPRGRR